MVVTYHVIRRVNSPVITTDGDIDQGAEPHNERGKGPARKCSQRSHPMKPKGTNAPFPRVHRRVAITGCHMQRKPTRRCAPWIYRSKSAYRSYWHVPCSASSRCPETRTRGRASGLHERCPAIYVQPHAQHTLRMQVRDRMAYLTILSSLSSFSKLISRMAVLGTPSSSASSRIFLSATI